MKAENLESDLHRRWAVERGWLAGLSLIFQIVDHILVGHFRYEAETDEDLLKALHREGVISPALYGRLRGAGGFRNVLVHEYVRIDPARVAEVLREAPDTFRRFAAEARA